MQGAAAKAGVKVCPRCGARLFEDMDVCYGCLYDFRNPGEGFVSLPDPEGEGRTAGSTTVPAATNRPPKVDANAAVGRPTASKRALGRELPTGQMPEGSPEDPEGTLAFGETAPRALLRVSSPSIELLLPLPEGGISFGRGPENDVILPARTASREHLRVVRRGEDVMAFDQGATNPTLLNGAALSGGVRLSDGDVMEVGEVSILLELVG